MSESTKKNKLLQRGEFNTQVVRRLAEKYGLTEYYIRQAINGTRTSETCDLVRKEYYKLCSAVAETLRNA